MKKILKYMVVVLTAGVFLNSCETTDLELRSSPNQLAADQADPSLLLNSMQRAYRSNMANFNGLGSSLTRISFMGGRDYFANFGGNTLDGVWTNTYSNLFSNQAAIEDINANSDTNYDFPEALGNIFKAHSLLLLVDYMGEATLSEAGNPLEFPAPLLDDGPTVYAGALALLDKAEALLNTNPPILSATDFFYDGDVSQWQKVINTIRLKAYVTTNNVSAFNAVIAGNNFISDTADDLQYAYGISELEPDNRHPDFANDYTPSGANIYHSNWTMETMNNLGDPRIRYYYFRQTGSTPGAIDVYGDPVPPNEETLACSLVVPPQHYLDGGFTYCSVNDGYWGRSHGNDEGTPPDGFTRTASGVYPAGGKLDGDLFRNGNVILDVDDLDEDDSTVDYVFAYEPKDDGVGLGLGNGGAGIEPILLASYVDFWRADMAANDTDRATFLQAGIEKSIAKTLTFSDPSFSPGALLDTSTFNETTGDIINAVFASSLLPTEDDITTYVDDVIASYNAATGDDKENIYAEQYWIAMFGAGAEAFNYYRKTGFPTTLLPNWEANPGPFPRTFLYPQSEVITNPNLTQRTSLTNQVFWDTNPAGPAFPPSN